MPENTKARFMEAVAAKVGKRQPVMKRKGPPAVVIAIGAPKPAPSRPLREDEASAEDEAEDTAEYGKGAEGGMCECPECGHKFRAGEHMVEDEGEDEGESESEDEMESED